MKAVVLITVYRRYPELLKNLTNLREQFNELGYVPEIVVLWACPEVPRIWIFQELLAEKAIQHVVGRPASDEIPDGSLATSRAESINLNKGLEFIKDNYPDHYVIAMSADIKVQPDCLPFIDKHMQEENAVLFHWENACVNADAWHTNFFAVKLDNAYWPPISLAGHPDTLERQWGLQLINQKLPFMRWHNSGERKFIHKHEDELPEVDRKPQRERLTLSLAIKGHKTIWQRVASLFNGVCRYYQENKKWPKY